MTGLEEKVRDLIKRIEEERRLADKRAKQLYNLVDALDHGALSGLGDDDHSQYFNSARHTKAIHDALNIDADTLDGKDAADFSNIIFNTTVSDIASGLTESTSYQDLDLTSYTSANAKGVILICRFSRLLGNNTHVEAFVSFRKNGSSVSNHSAVSATWDNRSGSNQTFYGSGQIICPCDSGQVIEWKVMPDINTIIENLYVVGYWE